MDKWYSQRACPSYDRSIVILNENLMLFEWKTGSAQNPFKTKTKGNHWAHYKKKHYMKIPLAGWVVIVINYTEKSLLYKNVLYWFKFFLRFYHFYTLTIMLLFFFLAMCCTYGPWSQPNKMTRVEWKSPPRWCQKNTALFQAVWINICQAYLLQFYVHVGWSERIM